MTADNRIAEAGLFIRKVEIELGDTVILELDLLLANTQNAIPFKEYVLDMISNGQKKIIIDLRNAYIIDSTFIGAMVVILKKIKGSDGKLRLVLNSEIKSIRTFFITGLDKVFDIYNNLDEAKQSIIE
jgi:anti-sigma B factor antagonist